MPALRSKDVPWLETAFLWMQSDRRRLVAGSTSGAGLSSVEWACSVWSVIAYGWSSEAAGMALSVAPPSMEGGVSGLMGEAVEPLTIEAMFVWIYHMEFDSIMDLVQIQILGVTVIITDMP